LVIIYALRSYIIINPTTIDLINGQIKRTNNCYTINIEIENGIKDPAYIVCIIHIIKAS